MSYSTSTIHCSGLQTTIVLSFTCNDIKIIVAIDALSINIITEQEKL